MPSNDSDPLSDPLLSHPETGSTWQATLLIASSEPVIRDGLSTRLKTAGYDVRIAETGQAALESALDSPPALIVLDFAAADLDLVGFAQRIRSADETRFVPIVALTNETEPAAVIRAYQSGIDDVRRKPVDVDELAARIQAQIKSRLLYQSILEENRETQAAYAAQRDSEQLYHALFGSSPLPAFAVDHDSLSIKQANEQAATLTGYAPETLAGMPLALLCPGEAGINWLRDLCRRAASGSVVEGEAGSIIGSDGRRIAVEAALRRVEYRTESVIALLLTDLRPRAKSLEESIAAERMSMVRETAIAVNSRINDPLFVILNDIGSLQTALKATEGSIQSRLARVFEAAQRIQRVTAQLSAISTVVTKEYLPGVRMLDLDESVSASVERNSENDDE